MLLVLLSNSIRYNASYAVLFQIKEQNHPKDDLQSRKELNELLRTSLIKSKSLQSSLQPCFLVSQWLSTAVSRELRYFSAKR